MPKPEYTQGPWNAPLLNGETTGLVWADEPYSGVIASVHQLVKKDFGTTTANANLIAASPDMFEALEGVLRAQRSGVLPEWCDPVVNAIVKAKEGV